MRKISYLANVCLVLELDSSLSSLYWMNVNDPTFPFVGVIEHTNFEPTTSYQGRHIVYLSKYTDIEAPIYTMSSDELFRYALPFLQRMFPAFKESSVRAHHVWHARYAQPLVTVGYGATIPMHQTSLANAFIATMAQIFPEDRGTNYAIREGRRIAAVVADALQA